MVSKPFVRVRNLWDTALSKPYVSVGNLGETAVSKPYTSFGNLGSTSVSKPYAKVGNLGDPAVRKPFAWVGNKKRYVRVGNTPPRRAVVMISLPFHPSSVTTLANPRKPNEEEIEDSGRIKRCSCI